MGRIKDDKKEELNPYLKAEMDDTSKPPKPPLGELFSDHKFGEEMEGSKPDLGKDMKTREEMEGSNPELAMKAKLIAEAEGSRGGAEMDGCRGGVEMDGSRGNLRAEMPGTDPRVEVEATPTFAAVEMYAGDHGLYERPSPLIGRSGSAVPSPLSAGEERRPAVSSRNRPTRKPLRVASEGSGVSPDDTNAGRRSGGAKTSSPRSARGTPGSLTPNEGISSPSRSQERQHQRDARARRLNGSVSTRPTPSANLSSDDASGDEAWQQRYGGSLRTMEAATPGGGRGAERRRLLGSGNSSGETGDRAPLAGQGTPF